MALKTLTDELKKNFEHEHFRNEIQGLATVAVHKRNTGVFICMPAGAEKSLRFLLSVVLHHEKLALVICPSIAQIQDNLHNVKRYKINAKTWNSTITDTEKSSLIEDLQSEHPKTKILYLTPENAVSHFVEFLIMQLYRDDLLSYIIIHEAHCSSKLSHDFRPAYQHLIECRTLYPNIPIIALTATADKKIMQDILVTLQLKNVEIFTPPAFRENLYYDVWFTDLLTDPYAHLKNFIMDTLGPFNPFIAMGNRNCGIIYCSTKATAICVAKTLTQYGINTLAYYADLNMRDRNEVQNRWTVGDVAVIAATSAFGIGIDKASVRFVVHWTVPRNIGTYYQESGQAGRDGKPAICRLYVSHYELSFIRFACTNLNVPHEWQLRLARANAERMMRYCLDSKCRHAMLAKHFGNIPPHCYGKCDSCKNRKEVRKMAIQFEKSVMKSEVIDPSSQTSQKFSSQPPPCTSVPNKRHTVEKDAIRERLIQELELQLHQNFQLLKEQLPGSLSESEDTSMLAKLAKEIECPLYLYSKDIDEYKSQMTESIQSVEQSNQMKVLNKYLK